MPRKKQFDPERALQQAMELFWEKGFEATSIQDLLDRLGINRFSLYDTFQGKRELFEAALERYLATQVTPLLKEMDRREAGVAGIHHYFELTLARLTGPAGWWGCLMVNTAVEMAPHDRAAGRRVARYMEALEGAFYQALVRARKTGEVEGHRPARTLARFLAGTVVSLNVQARTRAPLNVLRQQAELALTAAGAGRDR